MDLSEVMKLNKFVEKQISDSDLKKVLGGQEAPGVGCPGKGCGSSPDVNVDHCMIALRKNN